MIDLYRGLDRGPTIFLILPSITGLLLPKLRYALLSATLWPATVAVHAVFQMADRSVPVL